MAMKGNGEYELHVLGGFRLEHGREEIRFPRRKVASLLAYLALFPRQHTRDSLATLLWGDFLDDEARHSLRTALSALRRELGDDLLLVGGDTVQLNPTFPLWVDALAFESYSKRFLAEPAFDLSTTFLDLYTGELLPLLYDEWAVAERDRLRLLHLEVLLHAAQQMRSRSEYGRAIEFAQRVLALDPANERAHQHMIFCYIATGDRSAALKQYAACRRALAADLGVEPMAETRALYEWIKGQPAHTAAREARITNLPIPLTSFVGRAREMFEIKRLLSLRRLVTLTGPGGSGKTRLAIQVATDLVDRYTDGVWFIDLAGVRDATHVANAIAQACGAPSGADQPAGEAIVAFLRARRTLLLLDNCEHVIGACSQVASATLGACPNVAILATSREPLYVMGEAIWSVGPLGTPPADAIPPSLAALAGIEATRLFIERATTTYPDIALVDQDAPAVAMVCRQLDGMPLAIELAAARAGVVSVRQIADHLHERFRLLTSGSRSAPARHASLRATIDWSYDLLTPDEQKLLRSLSLFSGDCALAAATAVFGDSRGETAVLDLLSRLVEKSLVVVVRDGEEKRYRLLETIKLYAWEKLLEAGERDSAINRFIDFYCVWTKEREVCENPRFPYWQWADSEHSNMQRAIDWCYETHDIERGVYLINLFWPTFARRGEIHTLDAWIDVIQAGAAALSPAWQARGFTLAGRLARIRNNFPLALALEQRALAAARASGDKSLIGWAMMWLGRIAVLAADYHLAVDILTEARRLELEIGASGTPFAPGQASMWPAHGVLVGLADALTRLGDFDLAIPLWEEALTLALTSASDSTFDVSYAISGLGMVALGRGDYAAAKRKFTESLTLSVKHDHKPGTVLQLDLMALVAAAQGEAEHAAILWGGTDAAHVAVGQPRFPSQQRDYEPAVAAARQTLGDLAYDKAYAKGQAMTIEQLVALALNDSQA